MKGKWIFPIVVLGTLFVGMTRPIAGAEIEISASVDRTVVGLNQPFTLTIEISGDKANAAGDPQLPDVSSFASYLGSSGTSQNIQIINGRMSVSKSFSFTFMATAVGKFTIPAAVIKYGDREYRSQPIDIEVVAASQQPGTQPRRTPQPQPEQSLDNVTEDNLFLRVTASKRRVYVNEPVILSYKIYTRVSVTQFGINKLPETPGFWVEEFPSSNQPVTHEEIVDGKRYIVAEIKKMALFPTDAGTKIVSPMSIECDVRVQTRRRSIFDSFFDDPFFGRTVRQLVNSKPVSIEVIPLPAEDRPSDFSGLVGSFNLTASVDKQSVKTNEAISLNVKIAGRGNIKMIPTPRLELPPDFERYEPKVTEKIDRTENGISGYKNYEYVLIPRYPGQQKIRPVTLSYFDLGTGQYRTLRSSEIVINVEKGSDEFMMVTPGVSKEEVRLVGKDIRFIQLSSPEFKKVGRWFYQSFYFILILLFPVLLIVVAAGYRRHLDKLSENVAYARSLRANQIAMKRLQSAKKLMTEKTQKQFYAEVSRSLMGFLGDKFNISAAGIITDEVENLMRSHGVDETVIKQYLNCLQICDYQRFAPANSKLDDMRRFFEQARQAIIALEKIV